MAAKILGLNGHKVDFRHDAWRDRLRGTSRSDQLANIIGGDISQTVCPSITERKQRSRSPYGPGRMAEEKFLLAFGHSAVKRAKWRGLMRNVAAAPSPSDDADAGTTLLLALESPEDLVKEQAQTALKLRLER